MTSDAAATLARWASDDHDERLTDTTSHVTPPSRPGSKFAAMDATAAVMESPEIQSRAGVWRMFAEERFVGGGFDIVMMNPATAVRHVATVTCDPFERDAIRAAILDQIAVAEDDPGDSERDAMAATVVGRRVTYRPDGVAAIPIAVSREHGKLRLNIGPITKSDTSGPGMFVGNASAEFFGDPFSESDVLDALAHLVARDVVHDAVERLTVDDGRPAWDPHVRGVSIVAPARPGIRPLNARRAPFMYRDLLKLWCAAWRVHRAHRADRLRNVRQHRDHQRWLGNRPQWLKPWTLRRWFSLEPERFVVESPSDGATRPSPWSAAAGSQLTTPTRATNPVVTLPGLNPPRARSRPLRAVSRRLWSRSRVSHLPAPH